MSLQGVLFDMDGVLCNTAEYHYLAWQRMADERGIPFNREHGEKLRGLTRKQSLEVLLAGRRIPEQAKIEMMERKNALFLERLAIMGPDDLLAGALELLSELRLGGKKIAVASSSSHATTVLSKLGVRGLIDVVCDGGSVARPKPAPDCFLLAARLLGFSPQECLVIEDGEAGIEAGQAAGMPVVGLGPASRVGFADAVFSDLSTVRVSDLERIHDRWVRARVSS